MSLGKEKRNISIDPEAAAPQGQRERGRGCCEETLRMESGGERCGRILGHERELEEARRAGALHCHWELPPRWVLACWGGCWDGVLCWL